MRHHRVPLGRPNDACKLRGARAPGTRGPKLPNAGLRNLVTASAGTVGQDGGHAAQAEASRAVLHDVYTPSVLRTMVAS